MRDEIYIRAEEKKLLDFCHSHDALYIYGAGNYGRGYLDVLHTKGIAVDGFLVSEKQREEFCGKGIYSVEEAERKECGNLGILPAYTNSRPDEIKKRFAKASPDVLDMDHRVMICLDDEIRFFPILDRLDLEFGVSPQWEADAKLESILVIRLDAIGDTVLTTPFIRELRKNNPKAQICAVIRKQNYFLLKNCPYIDELFLYDSGLIDGELADQSRMYDGIRKKVEEFVKENFSGKHFDAVFLPRELLCGRNTVEELALAYGSGAKYKIGRIMDNEIDKRFLYSRMVKSFSWVSLQGKPMHEAEYALNLLRDCGYAIRNADMELWPDDACKAYADAMVGRLRESKEDIIVALGIVASVETRTWRVENYKALIEECYGLYHTRVKFILLGGKDAVEAAKELHGAIVMDLTGKARLDQTAAIMEQCDLYVGSNTGLLHFASAFGKPSVTIYSELDDGLPTDGDSPFRMGAWQVPHIDLVPHAGLDGCHGVCRMGRSHCINLVTPRQALEAMEKITALKT